MMDIMGWTLLILTLASVIGVIYSICWLGADLLHPPGASVAQRLADLHTASVRPVELQLMKHRPLSRFPWLDHSLREWHLARQLDRYLQQTGWPLRVEHLLAALLLIPMGMVLVVTLLNLAWPWMPGLTGIVWMGGLLAIQLRRSRRRQLIETQLPDALDLIARAMQAGHALSSAILMAATEGPQPLADGWRTIFS
jgi:tight adherence protein B